jgi:hypothetical protein
MSAPPKGETLTADENSLVEKWIDRKRRRAAERAERLGYTPEPIITPTPQRHNASRRPILPGHTHALADRKTLRGMERNIRERNSGPAKP